jgi:benzodiazapine receptor
MASRRRPAWMPPPLTFPIVWSTMAVLRTVSSVMVFEALGCKLAAAPLIVFMAHLCVGDTWNCVNNAEQRLGVAVPGVLCCLGSACAATVAYAAASPTAGYVLLPLCLWLSVAAALVADIWRLNNADGRYPLYPTKKAAA